MYVLHAYIYYVTCLQTLDSSIIAVCATAYITPPRVGTAEQRTLSSCALHVIEPYGTYSLTIFGFLGLVDRFD